MLSHEILRQATERIGVKALAGALRVSPALVYKWCEPADSNDPDTSGARNPLDRLSIIVRTTGHIPVVNWLCHEAGGFFVHNPDVPSKDAETALLESTQKLVHKFSQLLGEISRSVADDDQIMPEEADQIREHWQRLKTAAETFVVACERGAFRSRR
jgi:hypothetical protein